jgi:hypothetical protein
MKFLEWARGQFAKLTKKIDYLTGRKYAAAVSSNLATYAFASAGLLDGLDPSLLIAAITTPWIVVGGGQAFVDVKKAVLGKVA